MASVSCNGWELWLVAKVKARIKFCILAPLLGPILTSAVILSQPVAVSVSKGGEAGVFVPLAACFTAEPQL